MGEYFVEKMEDSFGIHVGFGRNSGTKENRKIGQRFIVQYWQVQGSKNFYP